MINHARTLLMNRTGDHGFGWDYPGEEFVEPTFIPRALPTWLSSGLQALFGASPDRLYLNYRLRQLMALLHSTELVEYVTAFDPRITYWPMVDDDLFDQVFGITTDYITGPAATLYTSGQHVAEEGAGVTELQWAVDILDSQYVQVSRHTPPVVAETTAYTVTDNLSSEVPLLGSALNVRFQSPLSGTSWLVVSRARPQMDIAILLQSMGSTLGSGNIDKLFVSTAEPIKTFKNLWEDSDLFGYRYGALLMGIISYIDQLPQEL